MATIAELLGAKAAEVKALELRPDPLAGGRMNTVGYFLADAGARYTLSVNDDGVTVALAERTRTCYVSPVTSVKITGKRRWHTTVGNGHRAVLSLDTGEGISTIPGVLK